jgi:hypothetical protein
MKRFAVINTETGNLSPQSFDSQAEAEAVRDEWNAAYKPQFQTNEVVEFVILPRKAA